MASPLGSRGGIRCGAARGASRVLAWALLVTAGYLDRGIAAGLPPFPFDASYYRFPGSPLAIDVQIVDLNRDGRNDIIYATVEPGAIHVLLGQGDGTFAAQRDYSTRIDNKDFQLADIDGDGNLDAVTFCVYFQEVPDFAILLGRVDGSFGPARVMELPVGDWDFFTTGDVNRDGRADVLVCQPPRVSVLLSTPSGAFERVYWFDVWAEASCMILADMNGDSHLDLVVGNGAGFPG